MPMVKVSCFDIWSQEEREEISEIISGALIESFKVAESSIDSRFDIYTEDGWFIPENRSKKNIFIEITLFPGRTKEAKGLLYKIIFEKLAEMGVMGHDCSVVLYEPPLENWGKNGLRADQK